jgi:hypothetical protein
VVQVHLGPRHITAGQPPFPPIDESARVTRVSPRGVTDRAVCPIRAQLCTLSDTTERNHSTSGHGHDGAASAARAAAAQPGRIRLTPSSVTRREPRAGLILRVVPRQIQRTRAPGRYRGHAHRQRLRAREAQQAPQAGPRRSTVALVGRHPGRCGSGNRTKQGRASSALTFDRCSASGAVRVSQERTRCPPPPPGAAAPPASTRPGWHP